MCHGGKGGGGSSGGTTTQTSTVTPNPTALAAYQQALSMANTASSAPLQQYTGQQVAGFTPDQLQAFQTVAGTNGAASPYLNTAESDIQGSTAPLWNGVQQFSPSAVQQYESPYTQNVLDTTMAAENNQDAQQQAGVQGNAISSGAWGGDRSAVAQALTAGQQAIANNATNAGIENTGYTNAEGEFNNQQSAQLGANEANAYLGAQAGLGNINLAQNSVALPLETATAQNATGTEEQSLNQANLNVPYEEYLQQQAYPFQTAQYYADIAEGVAPGLGSTSTGSTTAPAPSTASQIGGGLLGGTALLGGSGAFGGSNGSSGWLSGMLAKGGRVPRAAGGGLSTIQGVTPNGVPQYGIPDFSVDFIPSTSGKGAPNLQNPGASKVGGAGGSSGMSAAQTGQSLGQLGDALGQLFGGSGGSTDLSGVNGSGSIADYNFGSDFLNSGSGSAADSGLGDASSSGLDSIFGSTMSDGFDFHKGGKIPQFHNTRQKRAIGGEVLPDIVSGVGDVVGAIFGDPGAGDQGVGILSNLDGGETKGAGVETQLFGMAEGKSHSQVEDQATGSPGTGLNAMFNPSETNAQGKFTGGIGQEAGNGAGIAASFFKTGGRAHYDDGGSISPITGEAPSTFSASPLQQNYNSQISQLPMDKLQELQSRFPPQSQQGQMVQRAIKQKQFTPNSGQTATAGLSVPAAPTSGQQLPQAGFTPSANGGRLKRDDGGYIPTPDQLANEQVMMQGLYGSGLDNTGTSSDVQPTDTRQAAFMPPTSGSLAQQQPVIPQVNASALQPPAQQFQQSTPTFPRETPPQYDPQAVQQLGEDMGREDAASSDTSSSVPQYTPKHAEMAKADPWQALATAGFAMMAGNSPNVLENVGRGALAGVQEYGSEKKEANDVNIKNAQIDQEAQKMADDAAYRNKDLSQKDSQFQQTKAQQQYEYNNPSVYQAAELANTRQKNASDAANQAAERQKPIPDGMGGFLIPNAKDPTNPQRIASPFATTPTKDAGGAPLTGDAYLASINPNVASLAKQIGDNTIQVTPYMMTRGDPQTKAAIAAAKIYNPDWNEAAYGNIQKFNTDPNGGVKVKSLNTVVPHLQMLSDLTDAMKTGDNTLINKAKNTLATNMGITFDNGLSDAANLKAAQQLVGNEIINSTIAQGRSGGALGDREEIATNLNNATNPEILKSNIQNVYMPAIRAQAASTEQYYKTNTGQKDFRTNRLLPETSRVLYGQGNQQSSGTSQTAQPSVTNWVVQNGKLVPSTGSQ